MNLGNFKWLGFSLGLLATFVWADQGDKWTVGGVRIDGSSNIYTTGTINSSGNITTDGNISVADITTSDDLTVTDLLTVNGNSILGNANTDTVISTAVFSVNSEGQTNMTVVFKGTSSHIGHTVLLVEDNAGGDLLSVTNTGTTVGGNLNTNGDTVTLGNAQGDTATSTGPFSVGTVSQNNVTTVLRSTSSHINHGALLVETNTGSDIAKFGNTSSTIAAQVLFSGRMAIGGSLPDGSGVNVPLYINAGTNGDMMWGGTTPGTPEGVLSHDTNKAIVNGRSGNALSLGSAGVERIGLAATGQTSFSSATTDPIVVSTWIGTYAGGSGTVCVNDSGILFVLATGACP